MKRIAIFASADSFEGFYGGTFGLDREAYLTGYRNDFIWEYAQGLRANGHEVFIYILSYGTALLREISNGLFVRFVPLSAWLRPLDVFLFRLRNIPRCYVFRDRVSYIAYKKGLNESLAIDRIEVFYNQEIWTPRFDVIVKKVPLPVVGAEQGAVYASWMDTAKREAFSRAAVVICQSHSGSHRARELGAMPELMYNGVDTDFFKPETQASRAKVVLAVGRFVEPQKRFADLLQAMRHLPDFELILVGSGPDDATLKHLTNEYGLESRVHFTGFVSSREELRKLYQKCGVFVSTSSWEGLALVMLEAMSCGAAVVASRIPSFEDLLADRNGGLLFPVGDVDALTALINEAWTRRAELGIAAREIVRRHYSAVALYKRLSGLMEGLNLRES